MNSALRVRDFMVTDIVTVSPETDVMRVIHILNDRDISGVLVVDSDHRLVGIATERDCIEVATQSGYFDEAGGPISDYMSTELDTAGPDDSLIEVAERMVASPFRRFPVLDGEILVGLIGRRDVLKVLASANWFAQK